MRRKQIILRWSNLQRLQAHMMISYVGVTVVLVLLLEMLVIALIIIVVSCFMNNLVGPSLDATALKYAYAASLQAGDAALNPQSTFQPGRPNTLAFPTDIPSINSLSIPYISGSFDPDQSSRFALLIGLDGQIVASSYPAHYPSNKFISQLLPKDAHFIMQSLAKSVHDFHSDKMLGTISGYTMSLTEIVWSNKHRPIGIIYVHGLVGQFSSIDISAVISVLLVSGLLYFIVMIPIGGLFGLLTTRGVVRRIHQLVVVSARFAAGDFVQHVYISRNDEIGQLEQQFNLMVKQVVDSITRQRELAEQNARLEERSHISRELHDAISQDLFSLSMLAGGLQSALPTDSMLQAQVAILQETITNMMREMRALLLELRPTRYERLNLAEALSELADAYQTRLGIVVETHIEHVLLSTRVEHAFLRIAQEVFTNAVRHAHASVITISLIAQEQQIALSISDNGTGFQIDEPGTQHGLGLRLIRERVQELQGSLKIKSSPGQGSSICVCIPQEKEET